jgi:hypothetical protein
MIHPTRLQARVAAQNRANAEANRLYKLLVEIFRPYVGKKILTQSGVIAKLKPLVSDLSTGNIFAGGFHVWRNFVRLFSKVYD